MKISKRILFIIFTVLIFGGGYFTGAKITSKKLQPYKPIIMIDLDGVLNDYHHYEKDYIAPLRDGAKNFIKTLYESNKFYLVLFTTRNKFQAKEWLKDNNIDMYFKDVTNIKHPAYIYIDDRAIQFNGDYDATLKNIYNFTPYWK